MKRKLCRPLTSSWGSKYFRVPNLRHQQKRRVSCLASAAFLTNTFDLFCKYFSIVLSLDLSGNYIFRKARLRRRFWLCRQVFASLEEAKLHAQPEIIKINHSYCFKYFGKQYLRNQIGNLLFYLLKIVKKSNQIL